MTPLRSLATALTASLVVLLGACDDGTSPSDLAGLDPLALVDDLNQLLTPLQASEAATTNLQDALPALASAGIALLPPDFPAEVAGETFAYHVETGTFRVDSTLTAAPDSGVSVLWYALDGSGEILLPLDSKGRIDLEPVAGGTTDSLALTVTRSDGPVTLLDLVQGRASTGTTVVTETFMATGAYSDGSSTVDLSLAVDGTVDTGTEDEEYLFNVGLQDTDTDYEMRVEGTLAGTSGDSNDLITVTATRGGAATVLEVSFQGDGETGSEEVSGTLSHKGTLIANISVGGNSYRFTQPNGDDFPSGQATELNALFAAMTRTGLQVAVSLPLFLP